MCEDGRRCEELEKASPATVSHRTHEGPPEGGPYVNPGPAEAGHYDGGPAEAGPYVYFWPSGASFGAPLPDDPRNSRLPLGRIMSAPLARFAPFFARYPSMVISVPASTDFLVKPRLTK